MQSSGEMRRENEDACLSLHAKTRRPYACPSSTPGFSRLKVSDCSS